MRVANVKNTISRVASGVTAPERHLLPVGLCSGAATLQIVWPCLLSSNTGTVWSSPSTPRYLSEQNEGIYQRKTCPQTFTAAQLVVTPETTSCLSTGRQLWQTDSLREPRFWAVTGSGHAVTRPNLRAIVPREGSQTKVRAIWFYLYRSRGSVNSCVGQK